MACLSLPRRRQPAGVRTPQRRVGVQGERGVSGAASPVGNRLLRIPAGISALALPAQALLLQFLPSSRLERRSLLTRNGNCWQFRLVLYMQAASRGRETDRHNGEEKLLLESF